ncbi:uncharacterized protein LOC143232206 isoform X2 [Tachypleus tridentatus]|uniref:uncharacterized protein LOC143232206 isoform X2 n=1 Tax=Tachypleus tridentatus TaxID=6853 RepID=UPI003FD0F6B5
METGRVFGVGPGVFIVAVIWSLAVFVFLAVSRTKRAGAKFKSLGECAAHVMLSNYITRELVQAITSLLNPWGAHRRSDPNAESFHTLHMPIPGSPREVSNIIMNITFTQSGLCMYI